MKPSLAQVTEGTQNSTFKRKKVAYHPKGNSILRDNSVLNVLELDWHVIVGAQNI